MKDAKRPRVSMSSSSMRAVAKLDNVIINVRDAGGRGRTVREFLLVFPGLVTNTKVSEVMRMVEHQLKQKLVRLQLGDHTETRLVLAGAGMTVVHHVGGRFENVHSDEDTQGEAVYVPDDGITLNTRRASYDGPGMGTNDTLSEEPVQWKAWSGETGLYNLLDGSFLDDTWLLNHPGKGLEERDIKAMPGYK